MELPLVPPLVMPTNQPSCEDRVQAHLEDRLEDLRKLWQADQAGDEGDPDLGSLNDYGLSFDYVPAKTFTDQTEGYFRYQISWGGPADEFRFFGDLDGYIHRIEYWFLDWFDGAHRVLRGKDRDLLSNIWDYLTCCNDPEFIRRMIQEAKA